MMATRQKRYLQKDFNNFLRCPKAFRLGADRKNPTGLQAGDPQENYTGRHQPAGAPLDHSSREVHRLACSFFPDAVHIYPSLDLEQKIIETAKLVKEKRTIIQPWFQHGNMNIFIDILEYRDGWVAWEIQKTKVGHIYRAEDFALHLIVLEENSIIPEDYRLLYINKKYVRRGYLEPEKLFSRRSVIEEAREKTSAVTAVLDKMPRGFLMHDNESLDYSKVDIGEYCFKPTPCDYFKGCWERIPEDSVFEIASMAREAKFGLYRQGIILQKDITDFSALTESQVSQISALKEKKEIADKDSLAGFLSGIRYPVHYLDFESIMPVIPLFPGTRPYQHLPVQYSLIRKKSPGAEPEYFDFLAKPPAWPLRSFIENLVSDLGNKGSIMVYDQRLEARQLREVGNLLPEFSGIIDTLIERIVDLIIPFQRRYYYSWRMKGLSSLKHTLPAIFPDFSYRELAIRNGYMAIMALESLYYESDEGVIEETRKNLKDYCQLDTLAMMKIHGFFENLVQTP